MGKIIIFTVFLALMAVGLTIFKEVSKNSLFPKLESTQSNTSTSQISQSSSIDTPKLKVIATGLEVPWALAFLPASPVFDSEVAQTRGAGGPDKSILVTERFGRIRLIDIEGNLLPNPIHIINDVKQTGESGLHGVVIHPNFTSNHFVYFYYTYIGSGDNTLNKVVRFKYENQTLSEEKIIIDKIPGAVFHDGGRIKFGPDGFLYVTTGDALNPSLSQDKNSLAGKILRVSDDGEVAPGNPYNNLVYSLGHRNPQGIAWDNQNRLWEVEHGQTATDEVNLIEMGKNYGWPEIRGDQIKEGMMLPKIHSGQTTWAPAGATIYNNSLYFGGLRGQALLQLNLDSLELKEHFKSELGRIRDVVLGPDNMLYITTSNRDGRSNPKLGDDKIIRVDPNQL